MPTPCQTHQGYNCQRFDTGLLEEIVALEIDMAVHKVQRENGIMISPAMQRLWTNAIIYQIEQQTFHEPSIQNMLPEVLQDRLRHAIDDLLNDELYGRADAEPPEVSYSGFCIRHTLRIFCQSFFAKLLQ